MTVITTSRGVTYGWSPRATGWGQSMNDNMVVLDQLKQRYDNFILATDPAFGYNAADVDHSAAISSADEAARVSGRVLYFPKGTYYLANVPHTAPWLGESRDSTVLKHTAAAAADSYMISCTSTMALAGMTLDGNSANQTNRTRLVLFDGANSGNLFGFQLKVVDTVSGGFYIANLEEIVSFLWCRFNDIGTATNPATVSGQGNAIFCNASDAGQINVAHSYFVNQAPGDVTLGAAAIQVAGGSTAGILSLSVTDSYFRNFGCASSGSNPVGVIEVYEFLSQVIVSRNRFKNIHNTAIKTANCDSLTASDNLIIDVTSPFVGGLITWSGNLRATGARWSSANIEANTIQRVTGHRGHAIDVSSNNDSPGRAGQVNVNGNIMKDIYAGPRLYGLHDVSFCENIVQGATATDDLLPSLLIDQCDGNVNVNGGQISDGASHAIRIVNGLATTRVRIRGVGFHNNGTRHIKSAGTKVGHLRVSDCDFTGAQYPLDIDNATIVDTRDNFADQNPATLANIDTYRAHGNSWDMLYGLDNYTAGAISTGSQVTQTITVFGAAMGNYVWASLSSNPSGAIAISAYVSAPDTVTVLFRNDSGGPVTPAGVIHVRVETH